MSYDQTAQFAADPETEALTAEDAKQLTSAMLTHAMDSLISLNRAAIEFAWLAGMQANLFLTNAIIALLSARRPKRARSEA